MLKLLIPLAIAALFVYQLAEAQEPGAGVDARQHNQMERIRDGVQSGELTRPETRQLLREQREIRREERAYRSDGVLTPRERADLHRDLDQASRDIYREKHDAQDRRRDSAGPKSIDERQARQLEAIRRGVESGALTPGEADRLRQEQMRIERLEQEAKADGKLTATERARIHRELDRSARHIRHETHDRERVGNHDQPRRNHARHDHAQRVAHRASGRQGR